MTEPKLLTEGVENQDSGKKMEVATVLASSEAANSDGHLDESLDVAANEGTTSIVFPASQSSQSTASEGESPISKFMIPELVGLLCNDLINSEIKQLRLTCRSMARLAELRMERIYLSPHPKSLHIFNSIAGSPKVAAMVREIVWDDSYLKVFDQTEPLDGEYIGDCISFMEDFSWRAGSLDYSADHRFMFGKPPSALHLQLALGFPRFSYHDENGKYYSINENDAESDRMTTEEYDDRIEQDCLSASRLYQAMCTERQLIIERGEDLTALRKGLRSFHNLRSVVIDDHMTNVKLDGTHLRRLLPSQLLWPGRTVRSKIIIQHFRNRKQGGQFSHPGTDGHSIWRSVESVLRELLQFPESRIDTLSMEISGEQLQDDNHHIVANGICKIRELNLGIDMAGQSFGWGTEDFEVFRAHHLKAALIGASKLERLSLKLVTYRLYSETGTPFPFSEAIPMEVTDGPFWPNLRSLELSQIAASSRELLRLFSHVKPTIESILLDRIEINRPSTLQELLECARAGLDFKPNKPKFVIRIELKLQANVQLLQLDEDLQEFFQGGGPNPFGRLQDPLNNVVVPFNCKWTDTRWAMDPRNMVSDGDEDYWHGRDWVDSMLSPAFPPERWSMRNVGLGP